MERIYAAVKMTSQATQAGRRGVAQDLWPGITDVLSSIPSRTNLLEWMRDSERFCRALIELAIEISLDNKWQFDLQRIERDISNAR